MTDREHTSGSAASPSRRRQQIAERIGAGASYREISDALGLSKSTVAYHARRLGRPANDAGARRYDWGQVQKAIDEGSGRLECMRRFGFASCTWYEAIRAGKINPPKRRTPLTQLLVNGRFAQRSHLKQRLFDEGLKQCECETCGISSWKGRPLELHLHHVNGDGCDNRLENLQVLCPNCHSQTPNYGGRNRRGAGRD